MNRSDDGIGDLLRKFYGTFGMPDEGPPPSLDVTAMFGTHVPQSDLAVLQAAIDNDFARRELSRCRSLLDDLATRLMSEDLLRELSRVPLPADRSVDELASGVFWFALASGLDKRDGSLPVTPFDAQLDLPLALKVRITVHGSLVLRLYVALVYMREGLLSDLINSSARAGDPCSGRVKRLLEADFVRTVRNALGHGSFSPCLAGLVFRDKHHTAVATPGFLNWLCTCFMLIQLQALSALSRTS
jgi:hypothetical protein